MEESKSSVTQEKVSIVVTLDGVFGFIGRVEQMNDKMLVLRDALTIGYDTDGTPFPTFGQLPAGAADPYKTMFTSIPVSNISYMVCMGENDEHSIVEQYKKFFEAADLSAAD